MNVSLIFCTAVLPYQIGNDVEGCYALTGSVEAHLCQSERDENLHTPILCLTFVPCHLRCVSTVT